MLKGAGDFFRVQLRINARMVARMPQPTAGYSWPRHGDDGWQPVTGGLSGDRVERRAGVYRKHTAYAEVEARAASWLRGHGLPAAEVLEVGAGWLVTREIPGRSAADPWPQDSLDRVVDAVADMTAALHAMPAAECPLDRRLAVTVSEARAAALSGRVDVTRLDPERAGWTTGRLLAELERLWPPAQRTEQPVVTHGDWCLPNLILDPDRLVVTGIVDTGRAGRADRCVDLALMARSMGSGDLNPQYGPARVQRFLTRCGGSGAELAALPFYRLLDEFF